jgi:long-chain acyl-CoA synthetase
MIIGEHLNEFKAVQPDKAAIITQDSSINYQDFVSHIESIQNYFEDKLDNKLDTRIALKLGNEPSFLEVFFAATMLGISCIPLDPKWTREELDHVIGISKPDLNVTKDMYEQMMTYSPVSIRATANPLDIFYIGFTSGSTGTPKGFQRHQRSWIDSFTGCNEAFQLTSKDIYCAPGPLCHSLSLFAAVYAIHIGATLVLTEKFEAQSLLDSMVKTEVSALFVVPTMLQGLLQAESTIPISSATKILSSGAKWNPSMKKRVQSLFPNSERIEYYGASETSFISYLDEKGGLLQPLSVGKAFPGVEVTIKDKNGKKLLPGEVGLLHVKSSMIFLGYLHEPFDQLLEEITVGDLAYIDEQGFITLVGREKNMIISGGLNIYPEEIEQHLKKLEAIEEVVVTGQADDYWGEKVVAIIKWKQDQIESDQSLTEYCRNGLASYKCPKAFYSVEGIPYTISGKVARNGLLANFSIRVGSEIH